VVDHTKVWADAEQRIGDLLARLRKQLSAGEVEEVSGFLREREYGLALEALACMLVDEKKRIELAVVREIDGIARHMHLEGEAFVGRLHQFAKSHAAPPGVRAESHAQVAPRRTDRVG
jgi:hypothetical protein